MLVSEASLLEQQAWLLKAGTHGFLSDQLWGSGLSQAPSLAPLQSPDFQMVDPATVGPGSPARPDLTCGLSLGPRSHSPQSLALPHWETSPARPCSQGHSAETGDTVGGVGVLGRRPACPVRVLTPGGLQESPGSRRRLPCAPLPRAPLPCCPPRAEASGAPSQHHNPGLPASQAGPKVIIFYQLSSLGCSVLRQSRASSKRRLRESLSITPSPPAPVHPLPTLQSSPPCSPSNHTSGGSFMSSHSVSGQLWSLQIPLIKLRVSSDHGCHRLLKT